MTKFKYIIIDGTNLFWRAFSVSLKTFIVKDDYEIYPQSIRLALTRLDKLCETFGYEDSEIYLCFDNPDSNINIRKYLSEGEYKSIRSKKSAPKGLFNSLSLFYEILRVYKNNLTLLKIDSLEADDLTLPLISKLNITKKDKCVCFSNDMDWGRNISENVYWNNYETLFDEKVFKGKYGFDPRNKKIQLYKCIHGDGSDSIKNAIPHLPREILLDIVEKYSDARDLLDNIWKSTYSLDWKKKIVDASHDLMINYQLVDFMEIEGDISGYMFKCTRDIKVLKVWYDILELNYENFMIEKLSPFEFLRKKKF